LLVLGVTLGLGLGGVGCGDDDDPVMVEPNLTSIQDEVFTKSCTFSSCHNDTKRHSALGGEVMSLMNESDSCKSLAGVASKRSMGKLRLVPGSPETSYLVAKLENMIAADDRAMVDDTTGAGRAMPWSNAPLDRPLLLDVQKRTAIADWIRMGAQGCDVPDAGVPDGGPDAAVDAGVEVDAAALDAATD